ncbi:MAG TPA: SIMPL domain-containing protein [Candidatus Nitrosopolaris sp.]|nr:SIMPL domain-containing protein [Candidatus Nitrosopolaris sp.]
MKSSSACTNNNKKIGASVYATCILGAAGALSLISIVYSLSIVTNSGDAFAQQYNASPQSAAHSSLIQKTYDNITNNNVLSVPGTATTKVKPDKVTLILGVETTNQTAKAALSTNSATMNKVLNVLLSAGVKRNETSTSAFSISPNYNYSQGRNLITGFTVTNSIQIESSNINDTARWIDTAISSGGATSVSSIVFTLSDKKLQEIKNGLIKQAINNARSEADIAASALGLKVLGIKAVYLNEFEQPPIPPQPFLQKQSLATPAGADGTPIISGQQGVSVSVSTDWLMK